MALIILGVLLILGVVFIALISRNIRNATHHHERTRAYDLAEAGIRHVHAQMLNSTQGADWRPTPTILPVAQTDPDYEYLRMPNPADPNDHGGPDKQGPYSRLLFERGRVLVRVRYAPSDPTVFSAFAVGDFTQPGMARNYTIIESVGKARSLDLNDPTSTSLQSGESREVTESSKIIAFVSIGMLEHSLFIVNKHRVSMPAEIGFASENAPAYYGDNGNPAEIVDVPVTLGGVNTLPNPYDPSVGTGLTTPNVPNGGSVWCNADLLVYGRVNAFMNTMLGDGLFVYGQIKGANPQAALILNSARPNGNAWAFNNVTLQNGTVPSLASTNPNFSTQQGLIKDGEVTGDSAGFTRGIGIKEGPSIMRVDPESGVNRYLQMTQLSGRVYASGNAGRYGHGQGPYINNTEDIQIPTDAEGRADVGSAESLAYDWLHPNNGQANSGWQGPFYVPRGAYLKLMNDGFIIVRDGRSSQNLRTWRMPDGSIGKRPGAQMNSNNPADQVDSPYIRYKLVWDPATEQTYIFNTYSVLPNGTTVDLNQISTATINSWRAAGYPFNGVLYFAGNVRVRGQIPTDMQLCVVSGGTIYIEGSITKGIVNYGTRTNVQVGRRITTPSKSMIALLAKDYVTLNTTQFFGSPPEQALEEVKDNSGPVEWNPVRIRTGGSIGLTTEFTLDPGTDVAVGGNPVNPSTWQPYLSLYHEAGTGVGNFEMPRMVLSHTMDDGPAPATFINIDMNYQVGAQFASGSGEWQYLFDLDTFNSASPFYPVGYTPPNYTVADKAPLYGLGTQTWQRYSKFEAKGFPLVTSDFTFDTVQLTLNGANSSPVGLYHLLMESGNDVTIGRRETVGGNATNDYVLARAAIVPHDIRIEAALFAEEGSFFVIPGPWFNPNPDDRRDNYLSYGANQNERDQVRYDKFGSGPDMPFYGEPLDVKIQIVGSVTENMPAPIAQQGEWLKKWGWIPRYHGARPELIPAQHVPNGWDVTGPDSYVPNLNIIFDPALSTARNQGYVQTAGPTVDLDTLIRSVGVDLDGNGSKDVYYALPPLPRLPVSPTLAYFGEVNP